MLTLPLHLQTGYIFHFFFSVSDTFLIPVAATHFTLQLSALACILFINLLKGLYHFRLFKLNPTSRPAGSVQFCGIYVPWNYYFNPVCTAPQALVYVCCFMHFRGDGQICNVLRKVAQRSLLLLSKFRRQPVLTKGRRTNTF